ncbi:MAG: glycoside hydrolase family 32 protein [Oscillospiraceae bacterium]|nr:glycoside hydrolase family 32 protein [Oscillospiraceae bacterium]
MAQRLKYHFEAKEGWINDPNGLIFYGGKYHAFFQHNPHSPLWGRMHWGHAVSADLINWEELPIALSPDMPYEDAGGCYSGSAIEKDGLLYLFYTSVSHELGQTQSVAVSSDGINFQKYDGNPVIRCAPADGSRDFRDPKVTKIGDIYYMVCGSGKEKVGKALLFSSKDLFGWDYVGVLFEGREFGGVLECPDFFPYGDKFVLMFSQMGKESYSTVFVVGDFNGKKLTPLSINSPEAGPHFYAPQTFLDPSGRRIVVGWLYSWGKEPDEDAEYNGALTVPRELKIVDGKIVTFPVSEAAHLILPSDTDVSVTAESVVINAKSVSFPVRYDGPVASVDILRDGETVEVFINGGEASITCWTD